MITIFIFHHLQFSSGTTGGGGGGPTESPANNNKAVIIAASISAVFLVILVVVIVVILLKKKNGKCHLFITSNFLRNFNNAMSTFSNTTMAMMLYIESYLIREIGDERRGALNLRFSYEK